MVTYSCQIGSERDRAVAAEVFETCCAAADTFHIMTANGTTQHMPRRSLVRWALQKRWRMTRALTIGGQVCVIDADGRILLVRHGYRPGWHFPGGGVEIGETIRDAALRELDEEAGIKALEAPSLHGIFSNSVMFPGDHVAVFVLRKFEQVRAPRLGFEIAEVGFFSTSTLPPDTTAGTRRRIAEITSGASLAQDW